ncbi:hypothetical protein D9M70_306400 [compost metagenome]
MIEAIEVRLVAWGQERISPLVEVSVRSPLGQLDQAASVAGGSGRCLSSVECWTVMSRDAAAIDQALHAMADQLGTNGRLLHLLAVARYCQMPPLPRAEQMKRLAISERTYRARVNKLHAELASRLPGMADAMSRAEAAIPAAVAAAERVAAARRAERDRRHRDRLDRVRRQAAARAIREEAIDRSSGHVGANPGRTRGEPSANRT